jgi:hydroxylamine dehydrogenase
LTAEGFNQERTKMSKICGQCHSETFTRAELSKADKTIESGDHLLAEAIKVVAGLYQDGFIKKPAEYKYDFPDLLTFHDAGTPIEQRLFIMHLQHRMRLFQGAFHANPDYSLWYGWSEMVRDLSEIKEMAEELRFRGR